MIIYLHCEETKARFYKEKLMLGWPPGIVVMGEDSRSKGHGFESRHHILDGHDIFHIDL